MQLQTHITNVEAYALQETKPGFAEPAVFPKHNCISGVVMRDCGLSACAHRREIRPMSLGTIFFTAPRISNTVLKALMPGSSADTLISSFLASKDTGSALRPLLGGIVG